MTILRSFLILLLLAGSLSKSQAQDNRKDRIILKDGSIIVGDILSYEAGQNVIFKLQLNGDTVEIEESKIYKLIFDGAPAFQTKKHIPFLLKDKGSFFEFSTNFMWGKEYKGSGLRASYFYSFNPKINIGANFYLDKFKQEYPASSMGLSIGFRSYFPIKSIQPMAGLDIGYSFARAENLFFMVREKRGGIMAHPYIGLQLGIANKAAFNFTLGYKYQELYYQLINYDGDLFTLDHKLRRVNLGINVFSYF